MFPSEMLRKLKDNWDGNGSGAPSIAAIWAAEDLYELLPGDGWHVVPIGGEGGVQIERHANGLDIEISITPATQKEKST